MRLGFAVSTLAGVVIACTDGAGPPLLPSGTQALAGGYALQLVNSFAWPYCASVTPDEIACYSADLTLTTDGRFTARWFHTHTIISLGLELRDTTIWAGAFTRLSTCSLAIAPPNEPNGPGVLSGRHLTFTEHPGAALPRVWTYAAAESSTVC